MKKSPVLLLGLLLLFPAVPMAADEASFEGGQEDVIVDLVAPGYEATVNLSIPAGYYVTNATMKVIGMAAENNASAFAENVSITLDNSTIWAFRQVGFGPLGGQNRFSTGSESARTKFGVAGGVDSVYLKLPKNATISNANMQISGSSAPMSSELLKLLGEGDQDLFGSSVACAGDVNGDGYDDVIVGADCWGALANGAAYIFFGGQNVDSTADISIYDNNNAGFGNSVSNAGDVNGDGYDDVIIGSCYYNNDMGRAYLYFGGQNMDANADVVFSGKAVDDEFGYSVSGAGDVNKDGYDDVIITSLLDDSSYTDAGQTCLYYGGNNMDAIPDIKFIPLNSSDHVSTGTYAGDMNLDGYDDVLVDYRGRVCLFFGGTNMDNVPETTFYREAPNDDFYGKSAGDVNGDGYPDILVKSRYNDSGGENAGRVFIFFGGQSIDTVADVILTGETAGDQLGGSGGWAGDVNKDGFDDVVIGAEYNDSGGINSGSAYVFFGGKNMDNIPDMELFGKAAQDHFGHAEEGASRAGDINNDGYDDVIIGSLHSYEEPLNAGTAYIYSYMTGSLLGPLNSSVKIGSKTIWRMPGYFNFSTEVGDFSQALNDYLKAAIPSGADTFGNSYVNVKLDLSSMSNGYLDLTYLKILYCCTVNVPDFSTVLNAYLSNHQDNNDSSGHIIVPLDIQADSVGRIKLFSLALAYDLPPVLVEEIGDFEILEDGWNSSLVDMYRYFQDDLDQDNNLNFNVVSATNSEFVKVGIRGKFLAVDVSTGDANDNWTGTVEVVVACSDRWGQRTESNEFTIHVKNVNDDPVITSVPVSNDQAGVLYYYNLTAMDGDNDRLEFSLVKAPANMTIDTASGVISWLPRAKGDFAVVVAVSDGTVSVQQAFTVTVPNKKPQITSTPVLDGTTGARYTYTVTAEDDNLDVLTFSVTSKIVGMEIGASTGIISWTPEYVNDYDVVVEVSDGEATAMQEFTVKVTQGNRAPKFISVPVKTATVGLPYEYQAKAMDEDKDGVSFSLVEPPAGMTIDSGKVGWTPSAAGNFTVKIKASDGRGGEKLQEFVVEVRDKVRPTVLVQRPAANEKVKGKFTASGTAVKGTLEVAGVQVRVDGGDWQNVTGNYTWQYSLDTTMLKNGKHALEARAFDGKDYSDIVAVDFTVDNQKAPAKGFIPGFGMGVLFLAMGLVDILGFRRKNWNRRDAE